MNFGDLKDFSEMPLDFCPQCGQKKEQSLNGGEPRYCGNCGAHLRSYRLFKRFDCLEMQQLKLDAGLGWRFKRLDVILELVRIGVLKPEDIVQPFQEAFAEKGEKVKAVSKMIAKAAQRMYEQRMEKLGKEAKWFRR